MYFMHLYAFKFLHFYNTTNFPYTSGKEMLTFTLFFGGPDSRSFKNTFHSF